MHFFRTILLNFDESLQKISTFFKNLIVIIGILCINFKSNDEFFIQSNYASNWNSISHLLYDLLANAKSRTVPFYLCSFNLPKSLKSFFKFSSKMPTPLSLTIISIFIFILSLFIFNQIKLNNAICQYWFWFDFQTHFNKSILSYKLNAVWNEIDQNLNNSSFIHVKILQNISFLFSNSNLEDIFFYSALKLRTLNTSIKGSKIPTLCSKICYFWVLQELKDPLSSWK